MNKKLIFGIVPFVLVIALLGITGDVGGHDYLNIFEKTIDPGELGSRIDSCLLCHIDPNGGGLLNPYGTDFANNTHNFTIIEQLDSDGDGFTNMLVYSDTWSQDENGLDPLSGDSIYTTWVSSDLLNFSNEKYGGMAVRAVRDV